MSQITLRNMSKELEKRIRALARKRNESLNTTINRLLSEALGIRVGQAKKRDLSALAATWSQEEYERFEESVHVFETIDRDVWEPPA